MKVLVLNCGSSSLKYQLIETSDEQIASNSDCAVARGSVERIGSGEVANVEQAIGVAFDRLTAADGALSHRGEIEAVGHRFVHGGEKFKSSVLIDDGVLKEIEALSGLAPLHNPENLKGYYASRKLLPDAKQVAVFDTSFHQTLPPRAYLYGLPYHYYEQDRIRRYGFHGTSHRYVSWRYAWLHGTTRETLKLITLHLGSGCSVCAVDHGRSIDTSMGFTPLDGLLMGTRTGELDPGLLLYLQDRHNASTSDLEVLFNQRSGLYGLTGSSDMRDVLARRSQGDGRARDAVDVFCYRVIKYVGAYAAVLGGADALIFTGGIGENAAEIRAQVCDGLKWLGVDLDALANAGAAGKDARITAASSKIHAWVIPTDEELLIARDTYNCVHGLAHL